MPEYGMDISAESYPDYDGFGWDNYWSCTDWMIWYGKLKQAYGVSEAKLRWKSAWEKQDNTSNPYLWCMYSDDFYAFIKENDAFGLLAQSIHQLNLKQFIEENPDKLPMGLQADSKYTISVRRSKA